MSRKLFLSFQPPVWGIWAQAEGWRMWGDKALDNPEWRRCHLCGRRQDFLFDFAKLIAIWDGEKVVKECRWHGPKQVVDCRTGETIDVPSPPRWPRLRRAFEGFVLRVVIAVRFVWFFLGRLFWRLVASNDVTFDLAIWILNRRDE